MKHVLKMPWSAEHLKEEYGIKNIKGGYGIYSGVLLPRPLRPFQAQDFSYARWLEDENNAHVAPPELREAHNTTKQEKEASEKISSNYANNHPQTLVIGDRFSNKNYAILDSIHKIRETHKKEHKEKLQCLIVTKESFIPYWREMVQEFPKVCKSARILIIDYSEMKNLISSPSNARLVKQKQRKNKLIATQGLTKINWDVIIFDEAEMLSEPSSIRTATASTLASLNKEYVQGKTPYTIVSLSEFFENPLRYTIASKSFDKIAPEYWVSYLRNNGFHIDIVKNKFHWHGELPVKSPIRKELTDSELLYNKVFDKNLFKELLSKETVVQYPSKLRKTIPLPIEVPSHLHPSYLEAWRDTKAVLNKHGVSAEEIEEAVRSFNHRITFTKKQPLAKLVKDLGKQTKIIFRTDIDKDWFKTEFYKDGFNVAYSDGSNPGFDLDLLEEVDVLITGNDTDYSDIPFDYPTLTVYASVLCSQYFDNAPLTKNNNITPFYTNTVEEKVVEKFDKPIVHYRRSAACVLPPTRLS